MAKRLRYAFLLVGLIIILCSIAVLAYSLWPLGSLSDEVTLVPTVFTPP